MREGGCLCGALRVCHCTFCQRLTGSAFAVWPVFAESDVTIRGEPSRYEHHSDESGRWIHLFFCPHCGATIYSRWQEDKGELAPLGGTFHETDWVSLPPGAAAFPKSSR